MGLNANTHIWFGVRMGTDKYPQNPLWRVPGELYDRLEDKGEIQVVGLIFRKFYNADESVGFGVELIDHGWREGSMELDLNALSRKVQKLMPRVKTAFSVLQIPFEPKVWLATSLP